MKVLERLLMAVPVPLMVIKALRLVSLADLAQQWMVGPQW